MNMIFLGFKRAYYGTLRGTRKGLALLGLTAARFDLLVAVRDQVRVQRELQRLLGVAASTLSEMLGAIEKLGWISRGRVESDRRYLVVELTKKGREALTRGEEWSGYGGKGFDVALPFVEIPGRDGCWFDFFWPNMHVWDEALARMVARFGNLGTYPAWHPED